MARTTDTGRVKSKKGNTWGVVKGKVTPLKTVQQLKADHLLLREENIHLRAEVENLRRAQERMADETLTLIQRNKDLFDANAKVRLELHTADDKFRTQRQRIAVLFNELHGLASAAEPDVEPLTFLTRLSIFFAPKLVMRMAMRRVRSTLWAQVMSRINEHQYRFCTEKVPMAKRV